MDGMTLGNVDVHDADYVDDYDNCNDYYDYFVDDDDGDEEFDYDYDYKDKGCDCDDYEGSLVHK